MFCCTIEHGITTCGEAILTRLGVRAQLGLKVMNTDSAAGIAQRGVVVEVFHDPHNRHGSTRTKLADLEMEGGAILN